MEPSNGSELNELLQQLRGLRLEGRHQGIIEVARQLLLLTENPVILAEAHMALANAFMWSDGDPGAAMESVGDAVLTAEAALGRDPANAPVYVSALTLQAEFLRWTGERETAHAVLERARDIAEGSPVLEGQVRIAMGRMLIGEITPDQDYPQHMAALFEAAAEQLAAGSDDLLLAWARVHDVFGLYCVGQPDLAEIAMSELSRMIEQGLGHAAIVQAHAVLVNLMEQLSKEFNVPAHVAVYTSQLLRIIRISS